MSGISFFDDQPLGIIPIRTNSGIGTLESAVGLSVVHKQSGTNVRSTFTLANFVQAMTTANKYAGSKLFTFPQGEIQFKFSRAQLTQKTTTDLASTINTGNAGHVGVGTAAASATTLATTMQNIIPSTSFNSSATVNVAGTEVDPAGVATSSGFFIIDGSSSPSSLYLNSAYASGVSGDGIQTWSGIIVAEWELLKYSFGY